MYFPDSISVAVMKRSLSLRSRLAVVGLRLVNALSRLLGRGQGTVAGGRVGLRIDPSLLRHLAQDREVIVVSGTNGKTTTSAMLAAAWASPVAHNTTGANMMAGHVAALASNSAPRVVLETDEAWLDVVVAQVRPAVVVLLNLSRDQLDRATEVRALAQRWRDMVALSPDVTFVANVSDPLVCFATELAAKVLYVAVPSAWHEDASACPKCAQPLTFAQRWSCSCGFAQPVAYSSVDQSGNIVVGDVAVPVETTLPGLFNRVNAAFAIVALQRVGEDQARVASRLSAVSVVQGRYGVRRWRERTLRLLLAKNPAGVAALLADLDSSGEIWVAINAQIADGRDPSWLYDAPFEWLAGRTVHCLGERRLDLATRLAIDGVDHRVIDDEETLATGSDTVTLIANYTTFQHWLAVSTPC